MMAGRKSRLRPTPISVKCGLYPGMQDPARNRAKIEPTWRLPPEYPARQSVGAYRTRGRLYAAVDQVGLGGTIDDGLIHYDLADLLL